MQGFKKLRTNCGTFLWLDLDWPGLARGFALLRMPRMPELRGKTFPEFEETTIDTNTIRYQDKAREKQRRKLLAELALRKEEEGSNPPRKKFQQTKSWSKQKNRKDRRQKRKASKGNNDEVLL